MEEKSLLLFAVFSVLLAFCLCYFFLNFRRLSKKQGHILQQDDLHLFLKKGVYLKLVTIISKAKFKFENEKEVEVYGFEKGTLTLEQGFVPEQKEGSFKPIKHKIFFELSDINFKDGNPTLHYIYKVTGVGEMSTDGITPLVKLEAEKFMSNVLNAGQKTS